MRNSRYLMLMVVALLIAAVGCKKTEEKAGPTEAQIFLETLSARDTTDATAISMKFMETLKAGQLDSAFAQLVLVDTARNILPLPEETIKSLTNTFTTFPVIDFTPETFKFMKPDSNLVVFSYEFAKAPEGQTPPTTRLATMPMKIDGKWYLTLPGYLDTKGVKTKTDVSHLSKDTVN